MTRQQNLLHLVVGADLLPYLLRARSRKQIPRLHDVLAGQDLRRDRRCFLRTPERAGENQIRRNLRLPCQPQQGFQVPYAFRGELPVAIREPRFSLLGFAVPQNINFHVTFSRPPRPARPSIALSPAAGSAFSSALEIPLPVRGPVAAPPRPRRDPGESSQAW